MSKASSVSNEAEQRQQAIRLSRERVRQQWTREGYDPMAHLFGTTATGDGAVINDFWQREYETLSGGRGTLASRLACEDMSEIGRAIRRWAPKQPTPETPTKNAA